MDLYVLGSAFEGAQLLQSQQQGLGAAPHQLPISSSSPSESAVWGLIRPLRQRACCTALGTREHRSVLRVQRAFYVRTPLSPWDRREAVLYCSEPFQVSVLDQEALAYVSVTV